MPTSIDLQSGFVATMDGGHYSEEINSAPHHGLPSDFGQVIIEMQTQNFDVIRFATYRTASKLRFLQKRTNLHLVDIWNMIEAFRENGLNIVEPRAEMSMARLESLVSSLFYQLNKRLPSGHQMDVQRSSTLLLTWLLSTYDLEECGHVRIFAIKVALSTMCSGKLMDKLRYIFSLISEPNGLLVHSKFADFIKDVVALPCSVFESPTFGFKEGIPMAIFDSQSRVTVNDFLDVLLSDPIPPCLTWLPLLHRLANVETVLHPVQCDGCNRASFRGFRYKCQRCYNYQLCQDCFWRGRVSGSHSNQHEMKEYTAYKSPSKQLGHSLKKSFRCVPEKQIPMIPKFPDEPEKTLNMSHIVPPSPIPSHNGFPHDSLNHSFDLSSLDGGSISKRSVRTTLPRSPPTPNNNNSGTGTGLLVGSFESSREDEHRLIARYATRLAGTHASVRSPSELSLTFDTSRQRDLISQLESKNREIMREIVSLRKQQEQEDLALRSEQNPTLLAELRGLRQRKEELETHLSTLQESRRELMVQLETLMKLLKNHQASPRSTPNSSPRSATSKSPPLSTPYPLSSSRSAPTTPGSHPPTTDSLMGLGGDVRLAFGGPATPNAAAAILGGSTRSLLRNDLLVAADSVTNAMSSLVRELNSGSEDEGGDDSKMFSSRDFETEDTESAVESLEGGGTLWREERQRAQEARFMDEIQARHSGNNNNNNNNNASEQASNNGQSSGATASDSTPSTVVALLPGNPVTKESKDEGEPVEETEEVIEPPFEGEDYPELYDNDPKDLDMFQRHASLTTDDESYVRTDDDEEEGTDWEESMRRWVNR